MSGDGLSLVQITDCHLLADPERRLNGVDTAISLGSVIDHILSNGPEPDAVLATGDLSEDGTAASYNRMKALLTRFRAPVYGMVGNHDDTDTLVATLPGDGIEVTRSLCRDGWQIVFLNTRVPGEEDGALGGDELAALDSALAERPDLHALVCIHHQPVVVGGTWADEVSLANPNDLFSVLDGHRQTRGVLFGHIHMPFDGERGSLRMMGSPSTCFQFGRDDDGNFTTTDDPAGYRRLTLAPDGAISTTVCWL